MNPETLQQSLGRALRAKPTRHNDLTWLEHSEEEKKKDFYEYLKENFNLTKDEFTDMLKEKHPESLI